MTRTISSLTICLLIACGGAPAPDGERSSSAKAGRLAVSDDSENRVVIVVNSKSESSRAIGEYYAERRKISPDYICEIDAPAAEETSRQIFEQRIEAPLRQFLVDRRLVESTHYIVTTQGVPLKVRGAFGRNGDAASVDSELTLLYGKIQGAEPPCEGYVPNPFFRQRDAAFTHERFPIYLVTRLAAYDTETAKALVDRALEARNEGYFVLDLKSETDGPGNNWLRTAAILLPEKRLVIDESEAVIYDSRDVIAYASWGSNDENRKRRRLGFRWLPGAIATEYVSTNGRTFAEPPDDWEYGVWDDKNTWFGGSPQGLAADLIGEGATGASGHVYEPYLNLTPRPDYLLPAYHAGRNLAESFYLSMPALGWRNIVIGDPLCALAE